MGTLNFHNLAERAQHLLDTVDLDQLDEDTIEGLMEAAAGVLPPGVPARPPAARPPSLPASAMPPRPAQPAFDAAPRDLPGNRTETTQEVNGDFLRAQQEVTAPEPEPTSSDFFKKSKKCGAQNKKSGAPCKAWATPSGYCVYHDPDYAETLREMQSRGGSRSPRKLLIGDAKRLDMDITDPGGIHAVIGHGLRLHLLGALTARQTTQLTRFLSLLVVNARTTNTAQLQSEAYVHNQATLLQLTDDIVERLEGRDLNDRLNVIQDAGSRREQVLKTNDRWAPRPTYRSARDYPQ